jgi:hypothetical protein
MTAPGRDPRLGADQLRTLENEVRLAAERLAADVRAWSPRRRLAARAGAALRFLSRRGRSR